jgi:hypothetical protein
MDTAGNLYGTAGYGEYNVLNELSPNSDGTWTATQLYLFTEFSGYNALFDNSLGLSAPLAIDKDGNLYGTAFFGGLGLDEELCYSETEGCGTVFELSPPSTSGGDWTETTLYYFQGANVDGGNPAGAVSLDSPTRLLGTTCDQGAYGNGTFFELNYSKKEDSWAEKTLINFSGVGGCAPILLSHKGSWYGTDGSQIYELTPGAKGAWPITVLYSAPNPGITNIFFGKDGNIYGTCNYCVTGDGSGSANGTGQAFELSESDGQWTMTILHVFGSGQDASYPGPLVQDKHGNFYGESQSGGIANSGTIFELSKSKAGVWTDTVLHSFPHAVCSGGAAPLFVDKLGNLYGDNSCGTFEFTP